MKEASGWRETGTEALRRERSKSRKAETNYEKKQSNKEKGKRPDKVTPPRKKKAKEREYGRTPLMRERS